MICFYDYWCLSVSYCVCIVFNMIGEDWISVLVNLVDGE